VTPSLIVLHYTAISCAEARARLCDPVAEVSAHYLISETGDIEALVPETARAWHAGAGEWAGLSDINSHSIGIELANTGAQPFANPQMTALETLLPQIMARWSIPPHRVIGHSDMAPSRKSDPGARFDWRRLALQGLSVWPLPWAGRMAAQDSAPFDLPASFTAAARAFGYPDTPLDTLLTAFRLRFRPWADGPLDQTDLTIAADLARRFGPNA
jgi:N-acetylmuramoyl-L-alanine amidase